MLLYRDTGMIVAFRAAVGFLNIIQGEIREFLFS